jgi:N6-L-threonylcarbamoyladenine synthase
LGRGLILGIETSCDETAAAVVERGRHTLSNVVASQIATHAAYGGVVPELASREHLRNIVPVVRAALAEAGIAFADLDAIAVTEGPGLAGALLVGITYAKALAFALGTPLIAVNHLEGHIHAVLLEQAELEEAGQQQAGMAKRNSSAGFIEPAAGLPASAALPVDPGLADEPAQPALALVVSGGHTHLYLARQTGGVWRYRTVGRTVDDAAGEAFDKVAKLLGLGYPGGPWIDALAAHGDPHSVPFRFAEVRPRPLRQKSGGAPDPGVDTLFSFSGIKTAVLRYVESRGLLAGAEARRQALGSNAKTADALALCDAQTLGLIASFQHAVVDNLRQRTFAAAERHGARRILVSGGVAANRELRVRFTAEAADRGLPIAFPSLALSTDNAAMIAAAAWPRLLAGELASPLLSAEPALRLGRE